MTLSTPFTGTLLLLLSACTKGDEVPAFLEIPAVELVTTAGQGAPTAKITDAWVSLNGSLLGVWELPARVPALAQGTNTITVTPAIKRNGTFDDRLRYPFFNSWDGIVDLVQEGSSTIAPQTTYISQTEFWIEAFEDAFGQFNVTDDSDTTLTRFIPSEHPELSYLDGSPIGGFVLAGDRTHMRIYSDEDYEAPGGPVFLELDYRSNVVLTVGVLYSVGGSAIEDDYVYLVPTGENSGNMPWNKIYIDLSPVFNSGIAERDIFIEADLPSGQGSAEVYLDNFKLLRVAP